MDKGKTPDPSTALTAAELESEAAIATAWTDLPPAIAQRRITLKEFMQRGIKDTTALARLLEVSDQTIRNDLRWMRKLNLEYAEHFDNEEHIGETVNMLKDMEQQSLRLAHLAETSTKWIETYDEEIKEKIWKEVEMIDHAAIQRHLKNAADFRKQITTLLQDVGMVKVVPRKVNIGLSIDISRASEPELDQFIETSGREIARINAEIAELEKDGFIKEKDPSWKSRLIGD